MELEGYRLGGIAEVVKKRYKLSISFNPDGSLIMEVTNKFFIKGLIFSLALIIVGVLIGVYIRSDKFLLGMITAALINFAYILFGYENTFIFDNKKQIFKSISIIGTEIKRVKLKHINKIILLKTPFLHLKFYDIHMTLRGSKEGVIDEIPVIFNLRYSNDEKKLIEFAEMIKSISPTKDFKIFKQAP